jgi:RNA polymerase sigma-54 factor
MPPANRPALALSQEQRLQQVLAPQLRQSLEMLQLPVLELRALVQQELQQNPTLEEKLPDTEPIDLEAEQPGTQAETDRELSFKEEFEILSRMDDEWGEYFQKEQVSEEYTPSQERSRSFFFDSLVQRPSLQEHLLRQLELAGLDEAGVQIGELLVGNINDDGYLTQSVEELAASTGFDPARVRDVLDVIQDFDPVGVGASDLKECLLLQLERMGQGEGVAAAVVRGHLEDLGRKRWREIAHALKVEPEQVQAAARVIGTLDPKPGRRFTAEVAAYIEPDVVVEKVDGEYVVILNEDQLPHLRVSREYRSLMGSENAAPDVKDYIRDRIRSSLFLIKSIAQRQQTLFKVATELVRSQRDFFEHGISHLKPLTMSAVAEAVGVHETTVCRCVANKYMKTPRGVFELKYFFAPGLTASDGRQVSNKTVRDMIAGLIAQEDPAHPLSDQDLVERLRAEGIPVARRTVAKYRVMMRIAPSHLRKAY